MVGDVSEVVSAVAWTATEPALPAASMPVASQVGGFDGNGDIVPCAHWYHAIAVGADVLLHSLVGLNESHLRSAPSFGILH